MHYNLGEFCTGIQAPGNETSNLCVSSLLGISESKAETRHLPVTTAAAESVTVIPDAGVARALRILVADDQDVICELIAEYLRADGHVVEVAGDGNAALEKFDPKRFDLVVTDQSMPGMSGEQLARAINESAPGTPVILLTGFGDEMQALGTLPEGICLIVSKPVSAADLRRAVLKASGVEEAQDAVAA